MLLQVSVDDLASTTMKDNSSNRSSHKLSKQEKKQTSNIKKRQRKKRRRQIKRQQYCVFCHELNSNGYYVRSKLSECKCVQKVRKMECLNVNSKITTEKLRRQLERRHLPFVSSSVQKGNLRIDIPLPGKTVYETNNILKRHHEAQKIFK